LDTDLFMNPSPRLGLVAFACAAALSAAGGSARAQAVAAAPSPSDSSQRALAYLDGALDFIQQNSIDRDSVDWTRLRADAHALARDARSEAGTYPAIRHLLALLRDRHSRFFAPDEANALMRQGQARGFGFRAVFPEGTIVQVYPGGSADRAGLRVGDTVAAVNGKQPAADWRGMLVELPGDSITLSIRGRQNRQSTRVSLLTGEVELNSAPSSRRLPAGMGYLALPEHLGAGEVRGGGRYADAGQAAIRSADTPPACGWIVDLRRNGGGNLWPMLAAVGPLLGEGDAGAFVGPATRARWGYRRGAAEMGGRSMAGVAEAYALQRANVPVAVLTSRLTASSGEAVAIAFRGRPRSRSFGEATQGVPTANVVRRLSDGAMLVLTTAVDADRTGHIYRDRIVPDQRVRIDWTAYGSDDDPVILAAAEWLRRQPGCRGSR
jgi:carboxyl-terminal processing protease